jgi:hypothetical protein
MTNPYARCVKYHELSAPGVMVCLEYNRLRQHYEAAIRRWEHVLLAPDAKLVGALARQAAEVKRKAFEERDAAKERLSAHELTCSTCNPRVRVNHKNV